MPNPNTVKYVVAVILFGTNGIVASHIAMSSYHIVLTRTFIGAMVLVAVFLAKRTRSTCWRDKRHLLFLLASGAAMGSSWLFLFEAYARVGVSIATLAYYCGPVIVVLLAPVVLRERLALSSMWGFLAVAVGMLCVSAQNVTQGWDSSGLFFGLLAAVAYSAMVILNKKAGSITGLENAMWQLVAAFLTVAAFITASHGLVVYVPVGSWIPVIVLGLLNTGLGCYLYFSSIGGMRAQSVAVLGYLEPLSALLFAAAFLGEWLSPLQMLGAALILGGAVFSELWRQRATSALGLNLTVRR